MMLSHAHKGLSQKEAELLMLKEGYNELQSAPPFAAFKLFLRQFKSLIVWILFGAALISYQIGETLNFGVILVSISFVVVMGFFQEFKAEKAMNALKQMVKPTATVVRDGKVQMIEAREIVPGDILALETGDRIQADATLLEITSLGVDESTLTGESLSIHKQVSDLVFAGTQITEGRALAKVTETGMKTKLGKIASLIAASPDETPLQKRIAKLGRLLVTIALVVVALMIIIGLYKGASLLEVGITALAVAVAVVPEGLPITITLVLSIGMSRMAKKNAIIRRMTAVETLGSTTVICTDKTGTLTENEMTVSHLYIGEKEIEVTGAGYMPKGTFLEKGQPFDTKSIHPFFHAALLCNNAELLEKSKDVFEPIGDPTEVALITMAQKAGFFEADLDPEFPRLEEIVFSSERKQMTTVHRGENGFIVYSKGAPEVILQHCDLSEEQRKKILSMSIAFGGQALRVLAFAMKKVTGSEMPKTDVESHLEFLGLAAMSDPARPEVKKALSTCKTAGIRVIMITGDHENTAQAIASQIGLTSKDAKVVNGQTLAAMSDEELEAVLKDVRIFARTQPEDKMRIINALKKQGHIVAMTGDGVNDAPALKKADIGIAMGIKGTDVSKEASDMILADDNFATIVEAVQEGRRIFGNIEKFTAYLISLNFTQVLLLAMGILFLDFHLLPLLAIQILFINLFNDELPAIGLGLDQAPEDLMRRPPHPPHHPLLTRMNSAMIFSVATLMAFLGYALFMIADPVAHVEKARTLVFTGLLCMIVLNTYNFRSMTESAFKVGFLNNRFLLLSFSIVISITLFMIYGSFGQKVFEFVPLTAKEWILPMATGLITLGYIEIFKAFRRRFFGVS